MLFRSRTGKSPHKLLEHLRFRAGYDFLLLRCASGEIDAELGEWWTAFYEGDEATREDLIASANQPSAAAGAKRKRGPRRGPRKGAGEGSSGSDAGHGGGDGGNAD